MVESAGSPCDAAASPISEDMSSGVNKVNFASDYMAPKLKISHFSTVYLLSIQSGDAHHLLYQIFRSLKWRECSLISSKLLVQVVYHLAHASSNICSTC